MPGLVMVEGLDELVLEISEYVNRLEDIGRRLAEMREFL